MAEEYIMIRKGDFMKEMAELIKQEARHTFLNHLERYDQFANMPTVMKLKEASEISGIDVSAIKYYAKNDVIKLIKPETGSKFSHNRISKVELMKLMVSQE